MIIDSSAIVSVLLEETDATLMADTILSAEARSMSAPNWLETAMVFDPRASAASVGRLNAVVEALKIEIVPFDAEMAILAREAFRRFGKGNYPARLNFRDCIAYALAKQTGETLLFKGDDFSRTDITPALAA